MKRVLLVLIAVMILTAVQTVTHAEANFSVSSLTASDVNCKKCHTDTPHIIHEQKSVNCENCHGDKKSVAIPQCTKCHDGPIHKVHEGKVNTEKCDYCHKNIAPVHTNLISGAVCSHCHKDLIEVHGASDSCSKCHKTPPEIVKPLKSPEMILVCQNCHPSTSVATIHGAVDYKQGCYNCHRGAAKINGSEVPHLIHENKATCKDCHEDNGKVVVPKCTKCHKIDELHSFNKIGKLTSGLECQVCHPGENKPEQKLEKTEDINITEVKKVNKEETEKAAKGVNGTIVPISKEEGKGPLNIPGFGIVSGIVALYVIIRKARK